MQFRRERRLARTESAVKPDDHQAHVIRTILGLAGGTVSHLASAELLQLSLRLQGRTSGAPGRPAEAGLAGCAGTCTERVNERGVCCGAGDDGDSRRRWVGSSAHSSCAVAHRRGPLPTAVRPRTPPRHTPAVTHRGSCDPRDRSIRLSRARYASRLVKGDRDRTGTPRIVGSAPPASTVLRIPLRGTHLRRAVDPGSSADPAGLTARARPEARPEMRATNL